MKEWIEKLRLILTMNEHNVLEHAGTISHSMALDKASRVYEEYKEQERERRRLESIKELDRDIKRLEKGRGGA